MGEGGENKAHVKKLLHAGSAFISSFPSVNQMKVCDPSRNLCSFIQLSRMEKSSKVLCSRTQHSGVVTFWL